MCECEPNYQLQTIISEISTYADEICDAQIHSIASLIVQANRVFVAGAGRSGFAARALSNRIMHLGKTTYFVGEPTTPAIRKGDLLIVGSGSGTTASLVVMTKKAQACGARIATLTMFPDHSIGSMADAVITIPGATPKHAADEKDTAKSVQPMGSLFEQLSWLTYDAIVMALMPLLGETSDTMFTRHANLE